MIRKILLKTIFILLVVSAKASAQDITSYHLGDEGLPSLIVYDIIQDPKGYMWFGTEAGICRYDGLEFKKYNNKTAKGKAISNFTIDSKNILWMSNFVGQVFYLEKDTIREFIIPNHMKMHSFGMSLDDKDNIYLNGDKIYKYERKTKQWTVLADIFVHNIYCYNNKMFVTNLQHRICEIQGDSLKKLQKQENRGLYFLSDIVAILDLRHPLVKWSKNKENIANTDWIERKIPTPANTVFQDNEKNIWVGTNAGIEIFKEDGTKLLKKILFPEEAISKIYQDKENNIWVSTLRNGLYVLPSIYTYIYDPTNSEIKDKQINRITTKKDHYVFGTINGKIYEIDDKVSIINKTALKTYGCNITSVFYDQKYDKIYVGADRLYHVNNNSIKKISRGSAVKSIDRKGDLILIGNGSSVVISTKNDTILQKIEHTSNIKLNDSFTYTIREVRSRAVAFDQFTDDFWIAFSDGLYYHNEGKLKHWKLQNKLIIAYGLCQDDKGVIWVASSENGLIGIKNHKIKYHYTTNEGLLTNYCKVVKCYDDWVWVVTDKGIQRIEPLTGKVQTFDKHDGLTTNEITDFVVHKEKVFLATSKGLIKFPVSILSPNTIRPPIYIESVSIRETPYPIKELYELAYDENDVVIQFQGLAVRSRGDFLYKYKMEGLDSTWTINKSNNPFARYSSIPEGNFKFMVKTINEDGVESKKAATLSFRIRPPFWKTWWFVLSMILLVILIVSIGFIIRIYNIRKKAKVEQDLRSSQLITLKVQMNPHFIFNALNSIQDFILFNEKRLANQFLGKFADLMRLTLDMSNEVVVSLVDELKALKLYLELEAVRFEENLEYKIIVDDEVETYNIKIPSMIIQPYVENSFKHGLLHKKYDKKIVISIKNSDKKGYLHVVIKDNGVGRVRSAEIKASQKFKHKSFATSATQKRLELLNFGRKNVILINIIDLYDDSDNAIGTKVVMNIPLKTN